MAETRLTGTTRYWRCKTCGAVYYNDPKTAPADWAWGCGKCLNPMEPVVVLPLAEHAALVALRDQVESDDADITLITLGQNMSVASYSTATIIAAYRSSLRAALRAGGKP